MNIRFELGEYLRIETATPPLPDLVRLVDIDSRNIDSQFFLVNSNGSVRIMRWGKSKLNPSLRVPEFYTEENFHRALRNKFIKYRDRNGKTQSIPLSFWWLKKPDRYTFDGIVFDSTRPSDTLADEINMWRGFGTEENPGGDWSMLREHIHDVLANCDKPSDVYIMRWLAWAVQNPTKAAEVAVALMSKEKGTGKGVLGRAMVRLFGGHGLQILQRSHLTGKFNAHMAQCGFLFSDEAIWPGFKEDEAVLKGLITEPTLQVEKKGQDTFTMPNALKLMLASNSDRVVQASKDERRYAVFMVSDKRKQQTKHFGRMQRQLDNGGLGGMLYDMLNMDLGGWHPREDIPETTGLAHQKSQSLDPQLKWLRGLLDSGALPWSHEKRSNEVTASKFFEHARRMPGLGYWHDDDFTKFLKSWGCTRKRNNGSWWVFPPLRAIRAKWLKEMPWSDPFDRQISAWTSEYDTPDDDFG